MIRRPRRALVVALVCASCTAARQPGGPTPLAVIPSRATPDAPVRVEISGRDLDARVETDFASGGTTGVDAGFSAWLEPTLAGSAVPLADVALTDHRSLVATVPAGLVPGTYDLVVVDPSGRRGLLERAYRVVASAAAVARFAVSLDEVPRVGVPFSVTVTAVDAAGALVDGFEGEVTLSDTAGALAPGRVGPLVYGRARARATIATPQASDVLTVTDAAGRSGSSPSFAVAGGPPAALVFTTAAVAVAAGACSPPVALALRDGTGAPTVADAAVEIQLQPSPAGVETYDDPGCTRPARALIVAAGVGGATFHFRAAAAGPVHLRALPASLPGAIQTETVTP